MDLRELEKNYGTEKQCLDYLYNLRWVNGYRCPRCQHNENWEISAHKYKCKKCGYQTTVIAGTLLQDTHIPINLWFKAIWYVTSSKSKITAVGLQNQLGLSSNRTALLMLSKIKCAMFSEKQDKLSGKIEVYWIYNYDYNHNLYYLIIAVEIVNNQLGRIGRIKLKRLDRRDYSQINKFIEDYVEKGSQIQCKKWGDIDNIISKGYNCKIKSDRYSFPYANKVNEEFQHWLLYNCNNQKIKISYNVFACDAFCKDFNKYKQIPSFEEILYNAMHLPPTPYANNKAKK